ncbi:hypothetical protein L210DRAFT_3650928 [Boletus edulis BED1]|uniref:Uncharacterized protein n=1 Tax=Boletus edulis BED1 TaxID=1328754 RepID=A0AAD4BJA1_BOLED|nr:hypothetical protein L210DRAFT_3650928 [Boletus edulis BED1]
MNNSPTFETTLEDLKRASDRSTPIITTQAIRSILFTTPPDVNMNPPSPLSESGFDISQIINLEAASWVVELTNSDSPITSASPGSSAIIVQMLWCYIVPAKW